MSIMEKHQKKCVKNRNQNIFSVNTLFAEYLYDFMPSHYPIDIGGYYENNQYLVPKSKISEQDNTSLFHCQPYSYFNLRILLPG